MTNGYEHRKDEYIVKLRSRIEELEKERLELLGIRNVLQHENGLLKRAAKEAIKFAIVPAISFIYAQPADNELGPPPALEYLERYKNILQQLID